jgi:hypothetical protein
MTEKLNQQKESISKEIERRWNIIFSADWQSHGLTFEYEPKGEEWEKARIRDGVNAIRGKFKSIRPKGDKILIETDECYQYMWNRTRRPQEDLVLEIPRSEIMPSAHGDMLYLDHKTADLHVFGVSKIFDLP